MSIRNTWMIALVIILGIVSGCASHEAAQQAEPTLPQDSKIEMHCIAEPVFKGNACIYEENRQAAQTVVLVHGINGSALRDWEKAIPALAEHYHVVAFDLPGFGNSSWKDGQLTPENYAKFIHVVTDKYVQRPFYLVGHSLGGAIALRYTALYPEDVKSLVIADAAGILHRFAYSKFLVRAKLTGEAGNPGEQGEEIEGFAGSIIEKFDHGIGRIMKYFSSDDETNNATMNAAKSLIEDDFSKTIAAITTPTLIMWGDKDTIAPIRTGWLLFYRIHNAKFKILPDAGHMSILEQAGEFNRSVIDFFTTGQVTGDEAKVDVKPEPQMQTASCNKAHKKTFEGSYDKLDISQCDQVLIRNAYIKNLTIFQSNVTIINSKISNYATTPLRVSGSELIITASRVDGDLPIEAVKSRLDLAGVDISGRYQAIKSIGNSAIIFSVSHVKSPLHDNYLQEFVDMKPGGSY